MTIEKRRLRMWLRMLRTTKSVETRLREFLRDKHDTTLPRFDVLAALYRAEDGLKMSALSKQLLVSNGNVTGIVDRLVSDGLVKRIMVENDRRSTVVCLSSKGRKNFLRMADQHAMLIDGLFSNIDDTDLNVMADIFARLKQKEDAHEQIG
ncbi:MAG: MarR family transcriptional regulator [Rhodospirillales bacterium]|nr:MarR family transcriptional regulator [Rhodospirillales bacterium]